MIFKAETKVLIQGITGKEGRKAVKHMLSYGTNIVCGVTPGKMGETVEELPVFDQVSEALNYDSRISASIIYVPPLLVLQAAVEAIDNGIKLIIILTENVPVRDSITLYELSRQENITIIGPSSIGVFIPKKLQLGSIGGQNPDAIFEPGSVAILSKSGGLCAETASLLSRNKIGQSIIVGLGGDVILCSTYENILLLLEEDPSTKIIVLLGEIGGRYEEKIRDLVLSKNITKPIVAYIGGLFAQELPEGMPFGHAGALINGEKTTAKYKISFLKSIGVHVAQYHHQIPQLIMELLK